MKYFLLLLLLSQTALQIACRLPIEHQKAVRRPFQKSSVQIKPPTFYLNRETAKGAFDPRPKIVLTDEKAGKYEFRWKGYDGKEKIVEYQRADALDALVQARVEKDSEGQFVYRYAIQNLLTSPTYLSSFTVQTLTDDVEVAKADDVYIGQMSNFLRDFKEGVWWHYGVLGETSPKVAPGTGREFSLTSSAPPGIVECRATAGNLTLKGVGEHMPAELEAAMPGYEEWARTYTIGPVMSLTRLSDQGKIDYLLKNLPKFKAAGWMTAETAETYESLLKEKNLAALSAQSKKDLADESITDEVFYIIEALF